VEADGLADGQVALGQQGSVLWRERPVFTCRSKAADGILRQEVDEAVWAKNRNTDTIVDAAL
jgi:hypothetical protein